jgi:hypothetical protein
MNFIIMGFERRGEWARLPESEQRRRIGKHQEGLMRVEGASTEVTPCRMW